MKASEARSIADQNKRPFEQILKDIESAAKGGQSVTCMPKICTEHQIKLIELGYKISAWSDPFNGFESTKIEW